MPDVGWDDVGGLETIKEALREAVEWPILYPDLYTYAGTTPPKGILLSGRARHGQDAAGQGRSQAERRQLYLREGAGADEQMGGRIREGCARNFPQGTHGAPLHRLLRRDRRHGAGTWGGSSDVTERVLSQMLTEMDGIEALQGVMVLAATNRPDMLDPALMRTGRFDIKFELPLPDREAREAIFQVHTRRKPVGKDVDIRELAALAEGKTGAEIEGMCRRAAVAAIREYLARLS